MAFGTGHHGTTQGCLLALDRLASGGIEGRSVLDLGCGTAVLAMAAARLWPARVLASDIDPVAVEVASANLRANGLEGHVNASARTGSAIPRSRMPRRSIWSSRISSRGRSSTWHPGSRRDLVPGAHVILSGILHDQADEVIEVYARNGNDLLHATGLATGRP